MEAQSANSNFTKANRSFKWTALAEIVAKLIGPILNMVLARFISPEIFGVVATLTVVTGLATTLTESGFARYVQQHQFLTKEEEQKSNQTSFTSALAFGILLFAAVAIANVPLSAWIGASGYGLELIVCAASIPFHAVSSIEFAILKKEFRFREAGLVRVAAMVVTAVFQIVMAVVGKGLWALTWGSLVSSLFLSTSLFFLLKDKKIFGFSWSSFKGSFVDNFFFILESLCVWLASALDILLLNDAFGGDLLGVYKLAFNTEKGIVALLGAIFSPILISLLSQMSSDSPEFRQALKKYQKALAFLAFPMGIGIFVFREGITTIFLGDGWVAAVPVFGFFALLDCIKISFSDFISTIMISKGKPLGSVLSQLPYLVGVTLCCVFAEDLGFDLFVALRACCTLLLVMAYVSLCKPFTGISPWMFFPYVVKPALGSIAMGAVCFATTLLSKDIFATLLGILIGIVFYLSFQAVFFKDEFRNFFSIIAPGFQSLSEKNTKWSKIRFKIHGSSVLLAVMALPCSFAGSAFLSDASTELTLFSNACDICCATADSSSKSLACLECSYPKQDINDAIALMKDLTTGTSRYSRYRQYYSYFVSSGGLGKASHQMVAADGLLLAFSSYYVQPSVINDQGYYPMEYADFWCLRNSMELINLSGFPGISITKKKADLLLEERELSSYEDLLGSQITYNSSTFSIDNVIMDGGWLLDALLDTFPDFAVTAYVSVQAENPTLTWLCNQQPYGFFRSLKSCVSNGSLNGRSNLAVRQFNGSAWLEDAARTERLLDAVESSGRNSQFVWSQKSIFEILYFTLLLGFSSFLALRSGAESRLARFFIISILGISLCGFISMVARLVFGMSYPFFSKFSLGLTVSLFVWCILTGLGIARPLGKGDRHS